VKPNEILAALLLKNHRPVEIARKLKIGRSAISNVIYGRSKSRKVQEEIAGIIGKTVEEIWPVMAA